MASISSLVTIHPRRASPLLVCKKCLGRIDDGKQLRKALRANAKQRGLAQNVKPPRVVMTSCFGICPKRAVVVASATTLSRGEYLLLRDADAAEDAAAVLMSDPV